ncbi:DNA binding methylated-DNA--cysteine S-methyltransferase [Pseudovirgaria hyperparasitica]|uniref:Methylated-DNA--protein-cysteine methyltransferase n=1 Tax=Pseudovirgaria hyperparasitica TaxID=470096 RepID=A0A6A6W2R5_9PEZI|nr:DNA binding methylated-DNA--cysteine S-methyltransferase [Pseudovirgaria hyperparasitica]KAF2756419.1 DNA binding methylated-DNA--cysteine S-methyltransferase [Pseudovirgaria hyperparasitica]
MSKKVTEFQTRVYDCLQQIPEGRIASYAAIARALNSSPRAVGGACRNNPFAPEVPCHRCIASTGFLGGFKGDWRTVPSGMNCDMKLELLEKEGVKFDKDGYLINKSCWWDDFKVKAV